MTSSTEVGFLGILTIIFIILKILNYIDWSWIWVLSPIWIPFILALSTLIAVSTIIKIVDSLSKYKRKRKYRIVKPKRK